MTDFIDLLPRFATPDTVVLPEQVEQILINAPKGGGVSFWRPEDVKSRLDWEDMRHVSLSDCRTDAQAPFRDKNGNRAFERDRVRDDKADEGEIYFTDGIWEIQWDNTDVENMCECHDFIEVTGMVPFGDDTPSGNVAM